LSFVVYIPGAWVACWTAMAIIDARGQALPASSCRLPGDADPFAGNSASQARCEQPIRSWLRDLWKSTDQI